MSGVVNILKNGGVQTAKIVTEANSDNINYTAVLWFFLGLLLIIAGTCLFIFREKIFSPKTDSTKLAVNKSVREQAIRDGTNLKDKATTKEGFENPLQGNRSLFVNTIKEAGLTEDEQYLINLQPLTANVAGYIGPKELGFFSPDTYLDIAIDAGIRSFILPISTYNDPSKAPPDWPGSGKPAILFRQGGENNKVVQSANGMTIKTFLENLLIRVNKNQPQEQEPILIMLKEQKGAVPDSSLEEEAYVKLMNDIAKELESVNGLNNYRLQVLGSRGTATQGGLNAMTILLDTPLEELKRKILFFTDFDLTILNKDAYSKKRSGPSLMDFINFRVSTLGSESQSSPQPNVVASASKQTYVKSFSTDAVPGSKINWADQARTTFLIASDDSPYEVQKKETVSSSLKAGIQMIPIPFFYLDGPQQKEVWDLWKGGAFLVKEKDARYTKPPRIEPAPPNPAFRAKVDGAPPGGLNVV